MRTTLPLLVLLASGALFADELRRNPFARPPVASAGAVPGDVTTSSEPTDLRIRAILLAGERSLVSIDGQLVGIGESYAGFVLQQVREDRAIFDRDGETISIPLFEQRDDDEDS